MAAFNQRTHEITITQFADNHHYTYTMELINTFAPTALILPSSSVHSALHNAVTQCFPDVPTNICGIL